MSTEVPQGSVTARVQSRDGWAVRGAVLTVTDLAGSQAARAEGDDAGQLAAGPLGPRHSGTFQHFTRQTL